MDDLEEIADLIETAAHVAEIESQITDEQENRLIAFAKNLRVQTTVAPKTDLEEFKKIVERWEITCDDMDPLEMGVEDCTIFFDKDGNWKKQLF